MPSDSRAAFSPSQSILPQAPTPGRRLSLSRRAVVTSVANGPCRPPAPKKRKRRGRRPDHAAACRWRGCDRARELGIHTDRDMNPRHVGLAASISGSWWPGTNRASQWGARFVVSGALRQNGRRGRSVALCALFRLSSRPVRRSRNATDGDPGETGRVSRYRAAPGCSLNMGSHQSRAVQHEKEPK